MLIIIKKLPLHAACFVPLIKLRDILSHKNGFIAGLLGRIPEENENPSAEYCGVLFTVLLTEDRCITKIKAKITKDTETSEEKESMQNEEKN